MKNFILTVILCSILCSCPEAGETEIYDYSIVNNSGQEVTMFKYINDVRDVSSKVILQQGEKLQEKFNDFPPYKGFSMWALFKSQTPGVTTAIEIIYNNNNKKKTLYNKCPEGVCTGSSKNIFNQEYIDEQTEVFTITIEDYQNATDCIGNCY